MSDTLFFPMLIILILYRPLWLPFKYVLVFHRLCVVQVFSMVFKIFESIFGCLRTNDACRNWNTQIKNTCDKNCDSQRKLGEKIIFFTQWTQLFDLWILFDCINLIYSLDWDAFFFLKKKCSIPDFTIFFENNQI